MKYLLGLVMLLAISQPALAETPSSSVGQQIEGLCSSRWPDHPVERADCVQRNHEGYKYFVDTWRAVDEDYRYLLMICQDRALTGASHPEVDWAIAKKCAAETATLWSNPFGRAFLESAIVSRKVTRVLAELAAIQQTVRHRRGSEQSFADISRIWVADIRKTWTEGDGFRHSFGGRIHLRPYDLGHGTGSGFLVQFQDLPFAACVRLSTSNLGRGVFLTAIDETTMAASHGRSFFDEEAAKSVCADRGNTISWVFQ